MQINIFNFYNQLKEMTDEGEIKMFEFNKGITFANYATEDNAGEPIVLFAIEYDGTFRLGDFGGLEKRVNALTVSFLSEFMKMNEFELKEFWLYTKNNPQFSDLEYSATEGDMFDIIDAIFGGVKEKIEKLKKTVAEDGDDERFQSIARMLEEDEDLQEMKRREQENKDAFNKDWTKTFED